MRQPKSLDEAKAVVVAEKAKLSTAISNTIGSRWLMAILATFVIAFAIHLAYSPDRLPNVSGLRVAQTGLPPDLDFGLVGEKAVEARDAALRQGAPDQARAFLAAHESWIPYFNAIGLGACFVLLLINMTVMTIRRPYTRG